VEQRRLTRGETVEASVQALVVKLPDHELTALIAELEASMARADEFSTIAGTISA